MTTNNRPSREVRGAVYVPARAFNAYQVWRGYDRDTVERDLGYAERANLNAVRTFLSYECWREDREEFAEKLDHLLGTAADRGIRVVPILFESAGENPTPERLTNTDLKTACAVRSPSGALIRKGRRQRKRGRDGDAWSEPRAFTEWVVRRFGDHAGLLALELMNEPEGWPAREAFADEMVQAARDAAADLPLTMGCKTVAGNEQFSDLDVYQFHHNITNTPDDMRRKLENAAERAHDAGKPLWLTEWQRTRQEPPDLMRPHYASLADAVRSSPLDGDFFWSLMVKPAYLPEMRERGRINGLFHEDGGVWSRTDFEAIAGAQADVTERPEPPEWMRPVA